MSTVVENIPSQFEVMDQSLESEMTLSMGPQHPSTHGVLRLDLRLDGFSGTICLVRLRPNRREV